MKIRTFLVASTLIAVLITLSAPVQADPPWRRGERGYDDDRHERHGKQKHKVRRGDCRVTYRHGPRGYEEIWKCTGPAYFQPGPPPWAPAHGYRRKAGQVLPAGLSNGRCRAELFDGPTVGGLIGAAAGGLTGSQFGKGNGKLAATALGTIMGFVIGQEVGRGFSRTEETCFTRTFEHVPDSETIVWQNPQQGAQYRVTPMRTAEAGNGQYCREYQAQATVGGRMTETYGTACRQPDGSWKLMN